MAGGSFRKNAHSLIQQFRLSLGEAANHFLLSDCVNRRNRRLGKGEEGKSILATATKQYLLDPGESRSTLPRPGEEAPPPLLAFLEAANATTQRASVLFKTGWRVTILRFRGSRV